MTVCIPFKDIEMASDLRIDLDAKFSSLKNELDFVSRTQEEVKINTGYLFQTL